MQQKHHSIFNIAVIVAALGYFVDIYDLLLVTIVKKASMMDVGATAETLLVDSAKVLNWQMYGMLVGGILWGVLGDKKGRLSVLFGSIILYSVANFATGYVQTVDQYAWCRLIAGLGLAGELGAGITLVSELMPKEKRGVGTSLVAGIGLFGAVGAYFTHKITGDWRLCYKIGGGLGIMLLFLRIKVAESGMFASAKSATVSRGNFLMFFNNAKRFKKYVLAVLIGLPTWYVIGIVVNQSDKFAEHLYGSKTVDSGRAIMFAYAGIALGDISIGLISQYFKSRKKALLLFYTMTVLSLAAYFSPINNSDATLYTISFALGFSTGFWAIFVTMGAEQFGTNIRATAATTIPNVIRGSLPGITFLFITLFQKDWGWNIVKSGIVTGIICILVTLIAFYFTEETFHKDLNYLEE
ncbi:MULTISPECIES: MFS transporter [unclassified Paraflavitalea]|uniref:MFS transporter n=1 Tax=unclassified Paraflavitalea TaxID=2798305 RepID=UPI003D33C227